MSTIPRVLLIDGSVDDRELARLILERELPSVKVEAVGDAAGFSRALVRGGFGVVVTEIRLGWIDGLELVRTIRDTVPECPVVILTARENERTAVQALQEGADLFVAKSSRGYLDLGKAVKTAMFRSHQRRSRSAEDTPYRRLVASLPVGVFTATGDGRILDANPALATILGFPSAEALADTPLPGLFLHPTEAERWRAQLGSPAGVVQTEVPLRKNDGKTVWTRISAWLVQRGPDADQSWIQGMIEDVSDERRARQEMARRNDVLAQSCAELENFASVVSHDLREPLHLVERYTRMLADRTGDGLDAKARDYMAHIVHGTERLRGMIDAILELSRVETRGASFLPVDFESVLAEAVANLGPAIDEADAEVTHDLLPTLAADETQMVQLFQNLIGNAVKFRGEDDPKIHVSAEERIDDWLFAVRDNGIGIEPEAASRIFEIFQRLHTQDEYPGMGIGLTLCQRIVQRHGGTIWLESEPGRGTTFFFTIPKHIGQWP